MDWNALKLFLAIAEHGTLTGAARALGVNHSTVFRRLNAFEEAIGSRLFERIPQGYQLTTMGEELLASARTIAERFDELERTIVGKDIQPGGTVKITAPNNIACRYLPPYLTSFNKQFPDIRIQLLVSNLEVNMNNRQADIAVRATPSPPEHLVGRKVRDLKWGVYSSRAYQCSLGKKLAMPETIAQLAEHRLIGAASGMLQLPAFRWLDKNLPDNVVTRCDELIAMAAFAEAGQGLAILPDDQQRKGITRLFTFEPGGHSGLWLLTHPDLRHVERIKRVMQFLAQAFSEERTL